MSSNKIVSLQEFKTERAVEAYFQNLNDKFSEAVESYHNIKQIDDRVSFSSQLEINFTDITQWVSVLEKIHILYTRYVDEYTSLGEEGRPITKQDTVDKWKRTDFYQFRTKFLMDKHSSVQLDLLFHFEIRLLQLWLLKLKYLKESTLGRSEPLEVSKESDWIVVTVEDQDCYYLLKWCRMLIDEENKMDSETDRILFVLPYMKQIIGILNQNGINETTLLSAITVDLSDPDTFQSRIQRIETNTESVTNNK